MEFIGPYGVPAGSPYVQGDAAANIKGSYLNIHVVTDPMAEILHVIEQAGLTPDGDDLTQLYQAIQAQIAAAIAASVAPAGAVMGFDLDSPPSGWIAGDGSAILRASYPRLDSAKYVGDSLNGTATAWYRCTNPSSPSTSRSTTGNYLVTRDLRGVFTRFLDSGRGIDPSRVLGSLQKGSLMGFDVPTVGIFGVGTTSVMTLAEARAAVGLDAYSTSDYAGVQIVGANATSTSALPDNIAAGEGATGVARPTNISLLGCIKY